MMLHVAFEKLIRVS